MRAITVRFSAMRITAMVAAGLLAGAVVTASPAQAEVAVQPALSHFYPQQPPAAPQGDPKSEVQDLLRQISDLDDSWDSLTPAQRQQRLAGLQQFLPTVDRDVQNLPPDQRPEVEGMLGLAVVRLLDLVRKAQGPNQPCYFPACLPGL
ncbi:MAG: hypothetical protein ACLP4W_01670 [Mycobacterium sp.]|uniref:hypothetical protein n=1 Tax=Mycobacterium sp. TaxID=1785 RepID=UPI003F9C418B